MNAKLWLCAAFVSGGLAAATIFNGPTPKAEAAAPVAGSHWRFHDGHWSFYHDADKRWYYTDGTNWFYNAGEVGWAPYRFDKSFGREGFEMGLC